jgi:hypothetical protein
VFIFTGGGFAVFHVRAENVADQPLCEPMTPDNHFRHLAALGEQAHLFRAFDSEEPIPAQCLEELLGSRDLCIADHIFDRGSVLLLKRPDSFEYLGYLFLYPVFHNALLRSISKPDINDLSASSYFCEDGSSKAVSKLLQYGLKPAPT